MNICSRCNKQTTVWGGRIRVYRCSIHRCDKLSSVTKWTKNTTPFSSFFTYIGKQKSVFTFPEGFIFTKLRICEVSWKSNPREYFWIYSIQSAKLDPCLSWALSSFSGGELLWYMVAMAMVAKIVLWWRCTGTQWWVLWWVSGYYCIATQDYD